MRRLSAAAAIFFSLAGALWAARPERPGGQLFEPAQVAPTQEPVYPFASGAAGTVILRVMVGRSGGIGRIDAIHGVPSLTEEAERAIRHWGFRPATADGRAVSSSITASFTFVTSGFPTPSWDAPAQPGKRPPFEPIEVISVPPAVYPDRVVASGAVILRVEVDDSGRAGHIDVIRGIRGLTEGAERAVRDWKFQPAELDGEAITSPMIASFTFRVLMNSRPCCPR